MVQWLGLCASIAGGMGSIPGQGTKILHAVARPEKNPQNTKAILLLVEVGEAPGIEHGLQPPPRVILIEGYQGHLLSGPSGLCLPCFLSQKKAPE